MADPARARRLAVRIREIVASTLETQVKDPRLGMVTITDARLTPDLRDATLYYTVYGDEAARAETAVALESARGVLRTQVGRQTGVKFTPTLTFVAGRGARPRPRRLDDLLAEAGRRRRRAGRGPGRRLVRGRSGAVPVRRRGARPDRSGRAVRRDGGAGPAGRRPRSRAPFRLVTEHPPPADPTSAPTPATPTGTRRSRSSPASGGGARLPREPRRGRARQHARRWRSRCARRGTAVLPSFSEPFEVPASLADLPGAELLVPPGELPPRAAAAGHLRHRQRGPARLAEPARSTRPAEVLVVDHHASNTRLRHAAPGRPGRRRDRGARRGAGPPARRAAGRRDRRLPLRGPGHRHRLVQVRGDHRGDPRAGRPAAAHRHPARPARPAAAGHPPRRLAVAWSAPRCPAPGWSRPAAGGLGLVWTDTRTAELAAAGLPADQAESVIDLVRTAAEAEVAAVCKELPGRRLVGVAAVQGPGGRRRRRGPRSAAAGTASPRASPPTADLGSTVAAVREAVEAAPRLPP